MPPQGLILGDVGSDGGDPHPILPVKIRLQYVRREFEAIRGYQNHRVSIASRVQLGLYRLKAQGPKDILAGQRVEQK